MTRYRNINKAQSTLEYAMAIACIVAALLAMQHYIKRATEGKLRDAADTIGGQYDAQHTYSLIIIQQNGTTVTTAQQVRLDHPSAEEGHIDAVVTNTSTQGEQVNKTGNETLVQFPGGLYD